VAQDPAPPEVFVNRAGKTFMSGKISAGPNDVTASLALTLLKISRRL
jgi:hypothetical protein